MVRHHRCLLIWRRPPSGLVFVRFAHGAVGDLFFWVLWKGFDEGTELSDGDCGKVLSFSRWRNHFQLQFWGWSLVEVRIALYSCIPYRTVLFCPWTVTNENEMAECFWDMRAASGDFIVPSYEKGCEWLTSFFRVVRDCQLLITSCFWFVRETGDNLLNASNSWESAQGNGLLLLSQKIQNLIRWLKEENIERMDFKVHEIKPTQNYE